MYGSVQLAIAAAAPRQTAIHKALPRVHHSTGSQAFPGRANQTKALPPLLDRLPPSCPFPQSVGHGFCKTQQKWGWGNSGRECSIFWTRYVLCHPLAVLNTPERELSERPTTSCPPSISWDGSPTEADTTPRRCTPVPDNVLLLFLPVSCLAVKSPKNQLCESRLLLLLSHSTCFASFPQENSSKKTPQTSLTPSNCTMFTAWTN